MRAKVLEKVNMLRTSREADVSILWGIGVVSPFARPCYVNRGEVGRVFAGIGTPFAVKLCGTDVPAPIDDMGTYGFGQMNARQPCKRERETCFAERRKNRRLVAQLDIEVRLGNQQGAPFAAEKAVTRDISSGDMYFESSLGDRLRLGDILDVEIELPVRSSTIFSEKQLSARGRVVRLGPPSVEEPNRRGVAIVFLEPPAFHTALD